MPTQNTAHLTQYNVNEHAKECTQHHYAEAKVDAGIILKRSS